MPLFKMLIMPFLADRLFVFRSAITERLDLSSRGSDNYVLMTLILFMHCQSGNMLLLAVYYP